MDLEERGKEEMINFIFATLFRCCYGNKKEDAPQKTIDTLLKDGWQPLATYGGLQIYGKGKERCLYDDKKDKVVIKYLSIKVDILKNTGGKQK